MEKQKMKMVRDLRGGTVACSEQAAFAIDRTIPLREPLEEKRGG